MKRLLRLLCVAVVAAPLAVAGPAAAAPESRSGHWTGTWGASMIAAFPDVFGTPNWSGGFDNQTLRQPVRVSRGGVAARIRVSNVFGTAPLHLAGASIGWAGDGASVRPGTLRKVTFGGRGSAVVPVGRELASDAVPLLVPALQRLTVTLYFAGPTGPASFHPFATATSYRAAGDHRFDQGADAFTETSASWYYLAGVDVLGGRPAAVVAFGDSITDGAFSTPDADNRYPDELAERLGGHRFGIVNAGIGGNRVLTDAAGLGDKATARFQRDALDRPGVRTVIVLEGINDIGLGVGPTNEPVTAQQLIDGHRALIRAAHARGVRVIGATILPFKGTIYPGYFTDRGEAVRDAVNEWIRGSGAYDAVADFDRAVADPADPDRLRPEYNSGDGLHPNDAGMRAMAAAVNLTAL
jgi:lysophospholipase L1-like esterase